MKSLRQEGPWTPEERMEAPSVGTRGRGLQGPGAQSLVGQAGLGWAGPGLQ